MPASKTDKSSMPAARKPAKRTAAQGKSASMLPESMITGKASPARVADGDKPVFAYIAGTALKPVPPVAMGKSTRGVELTSVEDLDERQVATWMKQVAAVPGVGGKKGQAQ